MSEQKQAEFLQNYQDLLQEMIESEQPSIRLEALKELGRMCRASKTK